MMNVFFNPKYLYLALDLGSFIVPFCFSFYRKASFVRKWKYYMPGIIVTAIIFLIWDEWFTQSGYWGFNPEYTSGIYIGSLPLEEVLFFICIPYACCFTYFAINRSSLVSRLPSANVASYVIIVSSILLATLNYDRAYTFTAFIGLGVFLIFEILSNNRSYLGRFYFTYLILLAPFFLVNGILTGSWIDNRIVWYNDEENLGIRLGTIPVEDIFYGMLMIGLSIAIAERLEHADMKKALRGGLFKR